MCLEDVTIDDLFISGLKIIQPRSGYRFGIDAVLLSGFARLSDNCRVADLGSGSGAVPLLLVARQGNIEVSGLEIQPDMAELARRSVNLNGLADRVFIFEGDIKAPPPQLKKGRFDVVVTNPPYLRKNQGRVNPSPGLALARHEMACSLDDVIRTAGSLLRYRGQFCMIHRTDRLAEALDRLREHGLEPKRLRLVHPALNRDSNLFLVESVKGGHPGVTVEPPLAIYDAKGEYTPDVLDIYAGSAPPRSVRRGATSGAGNK